MDEKSDQIVNHIEQQREMLGRNLDELENKVSSATDWRTHFDRNPMLAMGVALGGGILLSAMVRGGGSRHGSKWRSTNWSQDRAPAMDLHPSSSPATSTTSPGTAYQLDKVSEMVDNLKGALFGFAAAKVKSLLSQALPGFEEHLKETEQKSSSLRKSNGSDPGSSMSSML